MAKVLHVRITSCEAVDDATVNVGVDFQIGDDTEDPVFNGTNIYLTLKTLGIYKTSAQWNAALMTAAKNYIFDTYAIATNAYSASYLLGGAGLLV